MLTIRFLFALYQRSVIIPQRNASTTSTKTLTQHTRLSVLEDINAAKALIHSIRQYSKEPAPLPSQRKEESDSDSDSDDEFERNRQRIQKKSERVSCFSKNIYV